VLPVGERIRLLQPKIRRSKKNESPVSSGQILAFGGRAHDNRGAKECFYIVAQTLEMPP